MKFRDWLFIALTIAGISIVVFYGDSRIDRPVAKVAPTAAVSAHDVTLAKTAVDALAGDARTKAPMTAESLRGYWRKFGILSEPYRREAKPGTMGGLEGGLVYFKTLDSVVWFIDFEPDDDVSPLEHRLIYMARFTNDANKECGAAMRDYRPAPEQCFAEEKILGWEATKNLFAGKVNPPEKYTTMDALWAHLEGFLRDRSR